MSGCECECACCTDWDKVGDRGNRPIAHAGRISELEAQCAALLALKRLTHCLDCGSTRFDRDGAKALDQARAQAFAECAEIALAEVRRLNGLHSPQNPVAVGAVAVALEKLAAAIRAKAGET